VRILLEVLELAGPLVISVFMTASRPDGEPASRHRPPEAAEDGQPRRIESACGRGALNAMLSSAALHEHCALDAKSTRLVADAVDRGGMSARAVHRALRVARTIADLACEDRVTAMRLAEALQYRAYEARRFIAR
jgi:magnesium chelatase family protein